MKKSKRYLLLLANLILCGTIVYLLMSFQKTESLKPINLLSAVCTFVVVLLFRKILKNIDSTSIFSPSNIQKIRLMGVAYLVLGIDANY